ncbi:50S ribosomal protein L21, mitochondrial-like isoform X2 [Vitis riparia]|uniref:50S ribosomal protein L21, mitochondrial-like isoform X2 n=1 Tax=Vitis riparia TaxID=96939 RepID=UPI00155A88FD|nr:50S ribosomal protein L21, mitochondrial-like isoform X2 [Vitis riparia]
MMKKWARAVIVKRFRSNCVYSAEDKELEADAIGCKVVGPLHSSDRVFIPYELVFAAVQIGAHQFKVSNGDCIYTEWLKLCEVVLLQVTWKR